MKKLVVLGFVGFSMAGVAFAEQNSCNFSRYKVCAESATVDLSGDCDPSRGGVIGTSCETANRTGSCVITEGSDTVFVRYYPGFPVNAEKNCKENKGTYVPN